MYVSTYIILMYNVTLMLTTRGAVRSISKWLLSRSCVSMKTIVIYHINYREFSFGDDMMMVN